MIQLSRLDKIVMGTVVASPFIASITTSFISAEIWLSIFFIELCIAFQIITDQRIGPKGHGYLLLVFSGLIEITRLDLSDWTNIDSQIIVFTLLFVFVELMEFHKRYESEKSKNEHLLKRIEKLEYEIQNK